MSHSPVTLTAAAAVGLAGLLALVSSVAVRPVVAQGAAPAALDGAQLYKTKTCFTCHGTDGRSPILPVYPKLAGQSAEYALTQMRDIKSGVRANGQSAAMRGIMHVVNDEEMEAIAQYLSSLGD
jgi:cytochrome c